MDRQHPSPRRTVWIWAVLALVILGLAVILAKLAGRDADPVEAIRPAGAKTVERADEPPVPVPDRDAISEEPEGLAFARSFWGDRWPDVEADLRARGKLRDWPATPDVPWEVAEQEFRERLFPLKAAEREEIVAGNLLQWHGSVDAKWLREVIGVNTAVDEDKVARIVDIVRRHNDGIEPLAQEWVERLDFEIRAAFRAGRYEHGPFVLPAGEPGPYFWTGGHAHAGWTARMQLSFEDCPGLRDMLLRIRDLTAARNAEVQRVVRGDR